MTEVNLDRRGSVSRPDELSSGQALIETALTVSLFALLLFGVAEFGRLAFAAIEVSNAASAGARYAAQAGAASDTTGIANAAANDAGNLTDLSTSSSYSCICSDGSSSTCSNSDCSTSHIEETVTVNTQVSFDPLIHLPGLPTTYTLKGKAVEKCLQ